LVWSLLLQRKAESPQLQLQLAQWCSTHFARLHVARDVGLKVPPACQLSFSCGDEGLSLFQKSAYRKEARKASGFSQRIEPTGGFLLRPFIFFTNLLLLIGLLAHYVVKGKEGDKW